MGVFSFLFHYLFTFAPPAKNSCPCLFSPPTRHFCLCPCSFFLSDSPFLYVVAFSAKTFLRVVFHPSTLLLWLKNNILWRGWPSSPKNILWRGWPSSPKNILWRGWPSSPTNILWRGCEAPQEHSFGVGQAPPRTFFGGVGQAPPLRSWMRLYTHPFHVPGMFVNPPPQKFRIYSSFLRIISLVMYGCSFCTHPPTISIVFILCPPPSTFSPVIVPFVPATIPFKCNCFFYSPHSWLISLYLIFSLSLPFFSLY
ncbi:unnamed protein product [Acanthosepion pharaonis]|uniref:Uncharacterized protein n=1 Tax=Acanthosepion pharaonis TaxID=158019 RepID=A0A812BHN9_ACAPH|nr:unnamed protein product [Sepia pharaonis]